MSHRKGKFLTILIACFAILTGSGCFLQPVSRVEKKFSFIDMDAPAMRLARPVKAYLLVKDASGEWVEAGRGEIPAGAYIKGRKPGQTFEVEVEKE